MAGLGILRVACAAALVAVGVAGCGDMAPRHLKPMSAETRAALAHKSMRPEAPMFIRVYKAESELEVWKQRDDGKFALYKTYPVCNWSGVLGPKLKEGDKQAPEGFYRVNAEQMNPYSKYYLAFNIGFPNSYDAANGRTGKFVMVHGDCKSVGCYAMTDAIMEEIYIIARESLRGGQQTFDIHAYPFRMTEANMAKVKGNKWEPFWRTLKKGHDYFEKVKQPPSVAVCEKRYLVNVAFRIGVDEKIDPAGPCPTYQQLPMEALPQQSRFQEAAIQGPNDPSLSLGGDPTSVTAAIPDARPIGSSLGLGFTSRTHKPFKAFMLGPSIRAP
jgi:murein L,D-transpeptidase YafK